MAETAFCTFIPENLNLRMLDLDFELHGGGAESSLPLNTGSALDAPRDRIID